jgi:hypothetical protein
MPAVDRPVSGVDWREVDNDVGFHFTIMAQSPAATLFSFIQLIQVNQLYKQREHIRGILQYIQWNEGTQFPKD